MKSGDDEFAKRIIETDCSFRSGFAQGPRSRPSENRADEKFADLPKLFAALNLPAASDFRKNDARNCCERYVGTYQSPRFDVTVERDGDEFLLGFNDASKSPLEENGPNEFLMGTTGHSIQNGRRTGGRVGRLFGPTEVIAKPITSQPDAQPNNPPTTEPDNSAATAKTVEFGPSSRASLAADLAISSSNWPGFRGNGASGVAEGQHPPIEWNVSHEAPRTSI